MADDKTKVQEDSNRISARDPYQVAAFAKKHGMSYFRARDIINEYGPALDDCNHAAWLAKSR